MKVLLLSLSIITLLSSCVNNDDSSGEEDIDTEMYFPPIGSDNWETIDINSLGWQTDELDNLYSYLEDHGTRAFIILKNGRIVVEEYWGNNILNTAPFTRNTNWYWASAGKTIVSFLVGIAQQEGELDIHNKSSDYLGTGWTSMDQEKEDLITVYHQLSMSTGLEYVVSNSNCTESSCLTYREDAGNQWFYHNAPYLLLKNVITNATGINYDIYTDQKLETKIGMSGGWLGNDPDVYWSTARDMARFGLLIQNEGRWEETQLLTDEEYFNQMTTSSQDLNPSYGYLWWLNGKSSIIYPVLPQSFNWSLSPNANSDLFAGMGKNGQFVEVVPSQNLVIIRMGEAPDGSLVPIQFHNEMWDRINSVIGN